MRFSANISLLFAEHPFEQRFERAAAAGFEAVELWWPGDEQAARLPELLAAAGLRLAALNFDAGDMPAGDRGLLADPAREEQFRRNVPVALEIAAATGCPRLNALVGLRAGAESREEQLQRALENVRFAAELAAPQGAAILIEAVNTLENGPYLLASTAEAVTFVEAVGRDNVELLYDAYHMQRMEGNLFETIERHLEAIGHIQIADVPGRHQPGTGEIDFGFLLPAIEGLGYDGWVGLEYRPADGNTAASLAWLEPLRARLGGDEGREAALR